MATSDRGPRFFVEKKSSAALVNSILAGGPGFA
jgi:hypothetical protein